MEQWASAPMRSIALLFYCSRFSVPLISAVSILARISFQKERGGEPFS